MIRFPSDWTCVPVAEIAADEPNSFVIGPFGSNLVASDYRNEGVPIVFVRDIKPNVFAWKSNVFVTPEKARELAPHRVSSNDIVITKMGMPPGIAAVYPHDMPRGVVTADIIRLRLNRQLTHPRFVSESLNAPYAAQQIEKITAGQTRPKLTLRDFKTIKVLLPPLGEQRRIAAILSSVDDTIEKTQAVIDQLQVVKKAMMQELLTRGIPGRHTKFERTDVGQVPEGWEVLPLHAVLDSGPTNGRSPPSRSIPPGVPTFSIAAVRNGEVNIIDNIKYTDLPPHEVERYAVREGDILIVRGNANPDLMGRCGIVSAAPNGCIYPDILMRILCNNRIAPPLLVELWNSNTVHEQLLLKAKTTNGTFKVNQTDVASTLIIVPPFEEQLEILRLIQSTNDVLRYNVGYLGALQDVKSSLLSVLLTGEVRVTPDPEPSP